MVIEVFKDKAGEWRWRKKAGNNEIVASSGEGYKGHQDAWQAAHKEAGPDDRIVQVDDA